MNYNELTAICAKNEINVKNVAEALNLTYHGLKFAIERQTLPIKLVIPLCKILKIGVSEFFGESVLAASVVVSGENITGCGQDINYNDSGEIEFLRSEIEFLRKQIEIKDEQIKAYLPKSQRVTHKK